MVTRIPIVIGGMVHKALEKWLLIDNIHLPSQLGL